MPAVSRRTFVELATGMLTSLPVLAGGARARAERVRRK